MQRASPKRRSSWQAAFWAGTMSAASSTTRPLPPSSARGQTSDPRLSRLYGKRLALAQKLASVLPGTVARCGHGGPSLADWAAEQFAHADALILWGLWALRCGPLRPTAGIRRWTLPWWCWTSVAILRCRSFRAIWAGPNDLARALAAVCGAVPVITTATDANGVFAVDAWARHQNCAVLEPGRIKRVSSRLLAGGPVRYRSEFPIAGQAPAGVVPAGEAERADFALTLSRRAMRCT